MVDLESLEVRILGYDSEARVYVGYAPLFNVYSQAETLSETVAAVKSAVFLKVTTALAHGKVVPTQ